MSGITEAEKKAFAKLDSRLPEDATARTAGVKLADRLRRELPDVDDVTLGRVLLNLTTHLFRAIRIADDAASGVGLGPETTRAALMTALPKQLGAAAMTLTELEWKEMP
ncbi:hypothetical protein [Actinomadura nitritigenes]|uniref:hypothetical protein n=1 Tax=Actinomadura nitritigenes TaxID=134602 RepID=UPI003D92803C